MRVIELGRKLRSLLHGIALADVIAAVARQSYGGKTVTPKKWFRETSDGAPAETTIRAEGIKALLAYLRARNIEFKEEWLGLSWEEFERRRDDKDSGAYEPNYDITKLASALSGTYQLIRRFVDKPDRYIAEPLVIQRDEKSANATVTGYSHNEPRPKHLYKGQALLDEKLCFVLLERPHRSVNRRKIGRCLVMHPGFNDEDGAIEMGDAFSGLMLRGVKGDTTHQRGVGVPFVVIRVARQAVDLSSKSCSSIPKGECVCLDESLLIGEITNRNPEIFSFCQNLFAKLNFNAVNIVQTVPAKDVMSEIVQLGGQKLTSQEIWRKATETLAVQSAA